MKITLIRPSELVPGSSNALTILPVGIAYLAAYLEANKHETQVIDGVGENIRNGFSSGKERVKIYAQLD